ncbi:hypothetical protein ABZ467_36560 [Streptomyces sp. NPDC005727]|uniref:hypothetical protein n=1 Tax=Streptomyces sp. NPDC005727 TaxID=3157053 RepID=UPI0033F0E228
MRAAVALLPLLDDEQFVFSWQSRLLADDAADQGARLRVRPRLTLCHWGGDIDAAASVAGELIGNAVRHGRPFRDGCVVLRLAVAAGTKELVVEAHDALSRCPGFPEASAARALQGPPSGLGWVRYFNGRLSWHVMIDADGEPIGKAVQAVLPAIPGVGA